MVRRTVLYLHDSAGMASGQAKDGGRHLGAEPGAGFFWRKYVGCLWDCLIQATGINRQRHGGNWSWCCSRPDGEAQGSSWEISRVLGRLCLRLFADHARCESERPGRGCGSHR